MRTKWLLLALPLAILVLLLQSAFWVPTFANQAKGNPKRLTTFIRGDIADAKYTNPVVSSDANTSEIFDKNVFETLLATDENLKLSPLLADKWETTEEAYVAALPERKLPDGSPASVGNVLAAIETARKAGLLGSSLLGAEQDAAHLYKTSTTVMLKNAKGKDEPTDVGVSIDVPERVKLSLSKVEPHLFELLAGVLGKGYFQDYPFASRIKLDKPELAKQVAPKYPELLDVGEHNPIITFHLHPGIRWHDGAPFTSADVKFTCQAILDPKNTSPRTSDFDAIKQVETPDPLTARVVYKKLYAEAILSWSWMGIVPKHLLDDEALAREAERRHLSSDERKKLSLRTSELDRHPIGTGPFRFREWLPDQYIHLTRNESYWREKPQYEQLFFRVLPDRLALEVEFGAGALDLYEASAYQAERYKRDPHYQVVNNKQGQYVFVGYNLRRWPFQDVRVRRALSLSLDVDAMIKYVLSGEGVRSTGPFYSNTPFSDPDTKPLPFDPKQAQKLLEEAGFRKNGKGIFEQNGKPLAFSIVSYSGSPSAKAVLTIAQEQWRKLGVDCKVQLLEWTVFLDEFALKDNFDALVFAWVGGDNSPDRYEIWHSSQTDPYELNVAGYKNPAADALIEELRRTYDEAEQIRLARQLHHLIAEDQPYTFLFEPLQPRVIDRRIAIVEHHDGQDVFRKIETPPSGEVLYFFRQWRKLPGPLELAR